MNLATMDLVTKRVSVQMSDKPFLSKRNNPNIAKSRARKAYKVLSQKVNISILHSHLHKVLVWSVRTKKAFFRLKNLAISTQSKEKQTKSLCLQKNKGSH